MYWINTNGEWFFLNNSSEGPLGPEDELFEMEPRSQRCLSNLEHTLWIETMQETKFCFGLS